MSELSHPWLDSYAADVPHTLPAYSGSLSAFLDKAAQSYPQRKAIMFHNSSLTYAELQKKSEILAAFLRHRGIQEGDRVAIMLPNLPQTVIAFWAVMKAGATAVMTNPLYMEKELLFHFNDANVKLLITLDLLWNKIAPLRKQLPIQSFLITSISDALTFPLNLLYRFKQHRQKATRISLPVNDSAFFLWQQVSRTQKRYTCPTDSPPSHSAVIQYTGGTTGHPKGVCLSHANLGSNCLQTLAAVQVDGSIQHSFVALLPFFHVYGLTVNLLIPVILAATTLPVPRYVPQDILKIITKRKPTFFPGTPAVYSSLLQQKNLAAHDLKSIRICISGSAPLPRTVFSEFQHITGASIVEGFGLTEASPITHLTPLDTQKRREGSIGLPLPGTEACIMDQETGTQILPPNKEGELVIRGAQVMEGYLNNPEETAATLRDGWLYTGDIARMDTDGFFYIVDRKKDVALVGGYNVYPREVEEVILEHPDVLEACVVAISHPLRGESIKAFVVLKNGKISEKGSLITWCRSKLASYKVPREIEFRDALPKSLLGKVLRRELRDAEQAQHTETA